MKERKETISIAKANILSLLIFAITAAFVTVAYSILWGLESLTSGIIEMVAKPNISFIMWDLLFVGTILGGVVVHELIHGITWALFAKNGFKSISFGVIWKMVTPYCHCSDPLKVKHYTIGALMPLITMGIIPLIIGLAINNVFLLAFGVIFVTAASGDIMVAWKIRKEPSENLVLDHPSEAGYLVYENE